MRKIILFLLLVVGLNAKTITPNEVYAQTVLIQEHVHCLLKYYGFEHDHEHSVSSAIVSAELKPRNAWQKAYEILVKINMLRVSHGYPRIEPVGMEAVETLNPDMVYEMTQRILTEIKIFEVRQNIKMPKLKLKTFKNKTSADVYNSFSAISATFNKLNRSDFPPNYVFAESMRIYDDLSTILHQLNIKDTTIPGKRLHSATFTDSYIISIKVLDVINKLQRSVGIKTVDFSAFAKTKNVTPSDIYSMTGIILAELQTIKAYIGLTESVTPPPFTYRKKVPADIEQLMSWNLRKLKLITNLDRR
jgi:hypothetical protein